MYILLYLYSIFYCFLIGNNNQNCMYFNALTVNGRSPPPYYFPCTTSNLPNEELRLLALCLATLR